MFTTKFEFKPINMMDTSFLSNHIGYLFLGFDYSVSEHGTGKILR